MSATPATTTNSALVMFHSSTRLTPYTVTTAKHRYTMMSATGTEVVKSTPAMAKSTTMTAMAARPT